MLGAGVCPLVGVRRRSGQRTGVLLYLCPGLLFDLNHPLVGAHGR